jgi:hypothetical protein
VQGKEEARHRLEGEARCPQTESGGASSMPKPHRADGQGADGVADERDEGFTRHRSPPPCIVSTQVGTISGSRIVPYCIALLPFHGPLSRWPPARLARNLTSYSVETGRCQSSGKRVRSNSVPPAWARRGKRKGIPCVIPVHAGIQPCAYCWVSTFERATNQCLPTCSNCEVDRVVLHVIRHKLTFR